MTLVRIFNTYEPVISLVRDLAPALSDAGLATDLVISKSEYRLGRAGLADCLSAVGGRVIKMPSGGAKTNSRLGKLFVSLSYALGASVYSLFARNPAANVFLTQPPLFFGWARALKLFRGQPYVVVLMDMYPDAAIANGAIREGSVLARVLGRIARMGFAGAGKIVVIGRCMQDRVIRLGIGAARVQCIPNWADEARIYPVRETANALRKELGVDGQFVVLYSGNMGVGHRFADVLEVARRVRSDPDIRFVFIGGGARRGEIEGYIERHRLENVLLRDFVTSDRMAEAQSLGDVHFVTLREEFEGIMVPSKVYGALAAGRPIIYQGSGRAEIARMISEEDVGAVVREGDVDHLHKVIVGYSRNRKEATRQGERALQLAHGKYRKQAAISSYVDTIREIVDSRPRDNA
jgi:glycosyltransferase involved in cell wall biosynthesis